MLRPHSSLASANTYEGLPVLAIRGDAWEDVRKTVVAMWKFWGAKKAKAKSPTKIRKRTRDSDGNGGGGASERWEWGRRKLKLW